MCFLYNNFFYDIVNIIYNTIYNTIYNMIYIKKNYENYYNEDDDIYKIIDNITKNKEILVNENNELILIENNDDNILIEKFSDINYNSDYLTESDDYVYIN